MSRLYKLTPIIAMLAFLAVPAAASAEYEHGEYGGGASWGGRCYAYKHFAPTIMGTVVGSKGFRIAWESHEPYGEGGLVEQPTSILVWRTNGTEPSTLIWHGFLTATQRYVEQTNLTPGEYIVSIMENAMEGSEPCGGDDIFPHVVIKGGASRMKR
jgi:hypothetical protein